MTVYDPELYKTHVAKDGEIPRKFPSINKLVMDMDAAGMIDLVKSVEEPADTTKLWLDIASPEYGNGVVKAHDGVSWTALTPNLFATHLGLAPEDPTLSDFVSVKDYGAVGNGVADDTSAINTAIAAVSGSGGMVWFPPGTYSVALATTVDTSSATYNVGAIKIPYDNVSLRGAGPGQSIIKLASGGDYGALEILTVPLTNGEPSVSNVQITGLTIDGNYTGSAISGQPLIIAAGNVDCVYDNLLVKNSGHYGLGLQNGGHQGVRVSNSTFENCWRDGIDVKNNINAGSSLSVGKELTFTNLKFRNVCRGVDGSNPLAMLDIMTPAVVISNIHFEEMPTDGTATISACLRLKLGLDADTIGRGIGGQYAQISNVTMDTVAGDAPVSNGIAVWAPYAQLSNVVIRGAFTEGVQLAQSFCSLSNVTIDGATTGVNVRALVGSATSAYPFTGADDCSLVGCKILNCTTGVANVRARTIVSLCHFNTCTTGISSSSSTATDVYVSDNSFTSCTTDTSFDADRGQVVRSYQGSGAYRIDANVLQVRADSDGASEEPALDLYRDSVSPAASDTLGALWFSGESSTGTKRTYAKVSTTVLDPTNASEDGQLNFWSMVAGTLSNLLILIGTALRPGTDGQIDLGTSTRRFKDIYLLGTGKIDFGGGDVTVTAGTDSLSFAGAGSGYSFDNTVTVTSTDAGATAGPILDLYRNSSSAAPSDLVGQLKFSGRDGSNNLETWGTVGPSIDVATSGSETSTLRFASMYSGALDDRFYMSRGAFYPKTANTADLGGYLIGFKTLYLGTSIDFGNNDVVITYSADKLDIDGGVVDFGSTPTVNGSAVTYAGGTDVTLADGGTGASLTDPNADRLMFWDDSAGSVAWLTLGTGLTITGTTLDAAAASFTPFASRAKATRITSGITVSSATYTALTLNNEVEDTSGYWTSGSGSRMTIPSGVSQVLVWAYVQYTAAVSGNCFIEIRHKDSSDVTVSGPYTGHVNTDGAYGSVAVAPTSVSTGDYFEMFIYQSSGSSKTTYSDGRCFMSIAAVA